MDRVIHSPTRLLIINKKTLNINMDWVHWHPNPCASIERSAKGATRPRERAEPTEHIDDVFLVLRSSFARGADAGR
jgi:hypothetical protein